MAHYNQSVLQQWHMNAQRESFDMTDSMMDSQMFGLDQSVAKVEESWIDLEKEEEQEDTVRFQGDDHISASLTTILTTVKPPQDDDIPLTAVQESGIMFMELSDSSVDASLTRKSKRKRELDPQGMTHTMVVIGIIMSLSFSAGYALGSSRRSL